MAQDKKENLQYDYYDNEEAPEEEVQQEETPEQREDRELDELVVVNPRDHYRDITLAIIGGTVLVAMLVLWWVFYHPVVHEAQVTGRLMTVKCTGLLFKTYEGSMVSEQFITDSIMRKTDDFHFSIDNDSLSLVLMRSQNTGKRMRLRYKEYLAPLPWRGNNTKIITAIDQ
ncbi:MAG: hypothetical protein ACI308_07900 [Muribaculaceae bacterium]